MKKVFYISIGLVNFFVCGMMDKQSSELRFTRSPNTSGGLTRSKRLDSGESSPRKTNLPRRLSEPFPNEKFLREENLHKIGSEFYPGIRTGDVQKLSTITEK